MRGTAGVDGKALAKLVGWIAGVHVVTLGLAWLVSGLARLSPPRRIAFALVCPQKTEGMAIALIGIIFPDKANQGEMMLPIVAYHSVQMLVAALPSSSDHDGDDHSDDHSDEHGGCGDGACGDDACGGEDDGERLLHAVAGMSCDGLKPRSSSIDAAAEPAAKRTKMK